MLDLADDWMKRAVDVIGRALVAQRDARFPGDALAERLDDARLADSRFPREHHDLPFVLDRLVPAVGQQGHFLIATDESREIYDVGGERAPPLPLFPHAPSRHRFSGALEIVECQFLEVEDVTDEPARR